MGGEWTEVSLGDVVINHDAKREPVKKSERRPGPFPYYGASGVVDWVDGYNFDGEYVLIAEDGENLRTRQTPIAFSATGKFWVNNHAHVLSGSTRASTRFLLYALLAADIGSFITGAVMPKLTQASLHQIPLLLPCRGEQERIAGLLGVLDDKIELNRRMAETLEAMARALFKSWFVDFDPVHARIRGRLTGLPDDLAALFPDSFGADGLPKGWDKQSISDLGQFLNGLALQKYPVSDDDPSLPVIKIAELRNGPTSKSDRASTSVPSDYVVQDGDHLFSWSGSLIHCRWSHGIGALNQHLFKVTARSCPNWFLYQAVEHFLPEFRSIASDKAVTMGHIQRRHLDDARIVVPQSALMDAADHMLGPMHRRVLTLALQCRTLATLRDNLLPKLISGELRIADAEQRVAAA